MLHVKNKDRTVGRAALGQVSGSTSTSCVKSYYVYILKSLKDGKLYTGVTRHLDKRLDEHNIGKSQATKHRRPFVMIHSEGFERRSEAAKREYYLKSKKGAFEKFQILQEFESLQSLNINS